MHLFEFSTEYKIIKQSNISCDFWLFKALWPSTKILTGNKIYQATFSVQGYFNQND